MNDITQPTESLYIPVAALLIYQNKLDHPGTYVEAYDISERGTPVNAHPLTVKESMALAEALNMEGERQRSFLRPEGLIPSNVLYINPAEQGFAVWHTPAQRVHMRFSKGLDIPNGNAYVPALVWKASQNELFVYAVKRNQRLALSTPLYHAPFFNLYENGNVCMGSVKIEAEQTRSLEEFITYWQSRFWGSYFSHLIMEQSPVKGNIVSLWKELVNKEGKFPKEVLRKNKRTLKNIIL